MGLKNGLNLIAIYMSNNKTNRAGSRRIPAKWLGAFKAGHNYASRWAIDDSFAYELLKSANDGNAEAAAALDWLAQFNNEFHKDWFDPLKPPLHNTAELRKSCSDRKNARNRCVLNVSATSRLKPPIDE